MDNLDGWETAKRPAEYNECATQPHPQPYCGTDPNCAQGIGLSYRPPTLREQAEKNVGYHRDQADKHDRAAAFFRENPAFDEFIQLIRSGVIHL